MGDFIKKILSEEVHPDYDFIDDGEELMNLSPKHVKMILYVYKKMGIKYFANDQVRSFLTNFEEIFQIKGGTMLTQLLLVAFFNSVSDLVRAVERKDTSQLYVGPFYSVTMDYWEDGLDEDSETQSDDCENCDGYGYVSTECSVCDGSGESECGECNGKGWIDCDTCETSGSSEETDEEGDEVDCDSCDGVGEEMCGTCDGTGNEMCGECDGNGEIEDDCDHCDGSGSHETEIVKFTANAYNIYLASTTPIDISDYSYASEVLNDGDLLHGTPNWEDEQISHEDSSNVDDLPDTIVDFHSEDIIVNAETITSQF